MNYPHYMKTTRWRCSKTRSSVPPEMAPHKTLTAVAVFCAAISGGTLHLTLSFQPHDAKTKKAQAKMAKREKVSCGRVHPLVRVASASRSLKLLPRKIALKLNFRCLKSYRAIVVLNTAPPDPPPRPEGRVTPLRGGNHQGLSCSMQSVLFSLE